MQSLTDFGPVDFTGQSDSHATVQAAVDGCSGLLSWPAGRVRVDSSVNITRPLRIIGPGIDQWRTSTSGPEGCAQALFTVDPTIPVLRINHSNVWIDGLTIPGTGARFSQPDGGVGIVIGDVPGQYQDGTITGVRLTNVSVMSHRIGVHWVRGSDWVMDGCDVQGYHGMVVENLGNVDKGDSLILGCWFAADLVGGKGVYHKSSGGLRVSDSKFLNCQDSLYIEWTAGLSGGPIVTGCSFENMTRRGINVVGNGVARINGMTVCGNWFNGAVDSIFVDSSVPMDRLLVSGNNIVGGPTSILVNVGGGVAGYFIDGNLLDGNGGGYGIFVRAGAQGAIGTNHCRGLAQNTVYN